MNKERLYIFDTTLRDGAQTQGVDFSVEDKRQIALALDSLGVDYIEGGFPGANPSDTAFFAERPPLKNARFTAFGMTKRAGRSAANDPVLAAVMDSPAEANCLVGKTWDFQVDVALEIPRSENVDCIADSIAAVKTKGREPLLDAEHFFDGYKANPDYALECIRAAFDAGANWLVLCDTNGGTMPEDVYRIVSAVKAKLPTANFGIHAHNDTEQAVAVSLAAIRGGARQVQGTLNGLGERCGNANLCTLLPNLLLKEPYASQFETGISRENLARLTQVSRLLDEILNRAPGRHAAFVGLSAFAHKGGLHSSAVLKDPRTYEHVPPESVGNTRKILVSDQAGRSNVLARLAELGIDVDPKDSRVARLLEEVKQREFLGYAYEGAEASFELLARRALGQVPELPRHRGAPSQCAWRSHHGVRSGGKADGARHRHSQCGCWQRPGERTGPGAAQGPRRIFRLSERFAAGGLQGAYPHGRHGGRDPRDGRKCGWQRQSLVHGRCLTQYR